MDSGETRRLIINRVIKLNNIFFTEPIKVKNGKIVNVKTKYKIIQIFFILTQLTKMYFYITTVMKDSQFNLIVRYIYYTALMFESSSRFLMSLVVNTGKYQFFFKTINKIDECLNTPDKQSKNHVLLLFFSIFGANVSGLLIRYVTKAFTSIYILFIDFFVIVSNVILFTFYTYVLVFCNKIKMLGDNISNFPVNKWRKCHYLVKDCVDFAIESYKIQVNNQRNK